MSLWRKESMINVDGSKSFKYSRATLPFSFSATRRESWKIKFVSREKSEKGDERNLKRMTREIKDDIDLVEFCTLYATLCMYSLERDAIDTLKKRKAQQMWMGLNISNTLEQWAMSRESWKTKFVSQETSEKDYERNLKRMTREIRLRMTFIWRFAL